MCNLNRLIFFRHLLETHAMDLDAYEMVYDTVVTNPVCKVMQQDKNRELYGDGVDSYEGNVTFNSINEVTEVLDTPGICSDVDNSPSSMSKSILFDGTETVEEKIPVSPSFQYKLYSSWANQCKYTCQLCGKEINSPFLYQKHLKIIHKVLKDLQTLVPSIKVIKQCPFPSCTSEEEYNQQSLGNHVKMSHNIGLRMCYIKYVLHEEPVHQEHFYSWLNQNEYECKLCPTIYEDYNSLKKHLNIKHEMSVKQYIDVYKSMRSKKISIQCPFPKCKNDISMERKDVVRHAKTHSISIYKLYQLDHSSGSTTEVKFQWNQCKIQCFICSKVFDCPSRYDQHLKDLHASTAPPTLYSKESSILRHNCLLCDSTLTFSLWSVKAHIATSHDCSIGDYEQMFSAELETLFRSMNQPKVNQSENHSILQIKQEPKECFSRTRHRRAKDKRDVRRKIMNDLKFEWNQCEVHCSICTQTFSSSANFVFHLKNVHKKAFSTTLYRKDSSLPRHTCLICYAVLIFEYRSVRQHILRSHGFSMKVYEQQFSKELETIFNSMNQPNKVSEIHSIPQDKQECFLEVQHPRAKDKCVVSKGNDQHPRAKDKCVVSKGNDLKFDWNQCKIYCSICSKMFGSSHGFNCHLQNVHKKSFSKTLYGKGSILSRYTCLICKSNMIFERVTVRQHVLRKHKISIKVYEQQFSQELQVLFSSQKEQECVNQSDIVSITHDNQDSSKSLPELKGKSHENETSEDYLNGAETEEPTPNLSPLDLLNEDCQSVSEEIMKIEFDL